jgi:hypothetical protein
MVVRLRAGTHDKVIAEPYVADLAAVWAACSGRRRPTPV